MPELKYEKKSTGRLLQESNIYHVDSAYEDDKLKEHFLELKANICDLNPAMITKCITGTEQDFLMLMKRASD